MHFLIMTWHDNESCDSSGEKALDSSPIEGTWSARTTIVMA